MNAREVSMEMTPELSDLITIKKNIEDYCNDSFEVKGFENWAYSSDLLEVILGPTLYLETISTDFNKQSSNRKLKQSLQKWLASNPSLPSEEQVKAIQESHQKSYEERIEIIRKKYESLIKEKDAEIINILREKTIGFPSLARALAYYETLSDFHHSYFLERKSHPAVNTAAKFSHLATEKRELSRKLKITIARLDYYEKLFPWLADYVDVDIDALLSYVSEQDKEPDDDPVRKFLAIGEYEKLSTAERNQLALERYWMGKKKPWQLGRDYERYIGYLYEKDGFDVRYFGVEEGLGDLGRDLICTRDFEVLVVQCKYWTANKTIHEKHISQLFGTTVMYEIEQKLSNGNEQQKFIHYKPVFITSTTLSEKAFNFAEHLNVEVREGVKLDKYPCVKCNIIGHSGEKIYHLPMDQQYDKLITSRKDRFYVKSAIEAERLGFRRAWKWLGNRQA
ncbi:MAG: restriction endonuclease [Candidatus Kuenenia sp.]|nr:restriction endonuclease [Candidatus Kuenenia hertensis]